MALQKMVWNGEDGVAASIANTGYTAVTITDGGSMVWDDSWKPRGKFCLLATGTATSGALYGRRDITATDRLAYDQPIKPALLPTTELQILWFATGETACAKVTVDGSGVLRLRDAANAVIWTSAAGALTVGTGRILSMYVVRSATVGQARVAVYAEDGVTVVADSGLLTGRNTGAAAINRVRSSAAKGSTAAVPATYRFGEPRWDDAATGLLPAPTAHNPWLIWDGSAYVPVDVFRWDGAAYDTCVY